MLGRAILTILGKLAPRLVRGHAGGYSFDGREARWGPGNPDDFTTCRATISDLNGSLGVTMQCSDLDKKWTAAILLAPSGDLTAGVGQRTLTITGDTLLSGTYENTISLTGG
jgi:hypothetical protein